MAVRPLLELGNPLLRQLAQPVDDVHSPETIEIINDLWETLHHFRSEHGWGRSLAAPLIGSSRRIIVLLEHDDEWTLINPRLIRWSRTQSVDWESCVAVGSLWGMVSRPEQVVLTALDRDGNNHTYDAEGLLARILQHEIDHLDGLMWLDRDPDIATICTTNEYRRRYKRPKGA